MLCNEERVREWWIAIEIVTIFGSYQCKMRQMTHPATPIQLLPIWFILNTLASLYFINWWIGKYHTIIFDTPVRPSAMNSSIPLCTTSFEVSVTFSSIISSFCPVIRPIKSGQEPWTNEEIEWNRRQFEHSIEMLCGCVELSDLWCEMEWKIKFWSRIQQRNILKIVKFPLTISSFAERIKSSSKRKRIAEISLPRRANSFFLVRQLAKELAEKRDSRRLPRL